ncbi:acyltransferase family protein [Legionella sp.]|uniref:acyltransferase family protein n=1 Tax=Legionella sp. TaxID=459 RepID=UPI00321FAE92
MPIALDTIEKAIPKQKSVSFSPEIESLRGVASLAVVMGHLYLFLFMPMLGFSVETSHDSMLNLLVAGIFDPQPAVLLFFTISGLVLGRQLRKEPIGDFFSFFAFLCRRAFRLIPLMWATTILAFFLWNSMNKLDPSILRSTLLLNDIGINVPLWSLKVELYCSIIFPVIFLLFEFGGKLINFFLFSLLTLLSFYWQDPIYIQFLVFFHAGLLVDRVASKAAHFIPARLGTLLLCLAVTILLLAPEFCFGKRNWAHGNWQSWVIPEIVACPFILLFVVSQPRSYFNAFFKTCSS